MQVNLKIENILAQLHDNTKLGDIRNLAKTIKKDHSLAEALWETKALHPRLLAILIMDKKHLTQDYIDQLDGEMQTHTESESTQLMDWLMANQLMKDSKTIALMETWSNSGSPLQRRTYWYHQARLRWVGQKPPDNTAELLSIIESKILHESHEVQWAMNFAAGWIGVYDLANRSRCIAIGKDSGLYKNEPVSKGCTPNYLPEFIKIESNKRKL
jgi:3-methyladenine DNA glycosylase AlkD